MINLINSNSSYLSMNSNNLAKRLSKELENQGVSSVNTETSNSSNRTASNLSMEDYMGMMQSYQMAMKSESNEVQTDSENGLGNIDADADGTISSDEYETLITQMGIKDPLSAEDFFAKYDTDGDGEITAEEMDAQRPMGPPPEKTQTISSDIDADGDGTISSDEYETLITQIGIKDSLSAEDFFAKYDTDGDGEITAEEMEAVKSSTALQTSQRYKNLAANTLNAYESNYQYTFGTDEIESSSIA